MYRAEPTWYDCVVTLNAIVLQNYLSVQFLI